MKTYNIKPGLEEFSLAREQFTKIVNFLISDSAKKLEGCSSFKTTNQLKIMPLF